MHRGRFVLLVPILLALAACSSGDEPTIPSAPPTTDASSTSSTADETSTTGTSLGTSTTAPTGPGFALTGAAEVPAKGDPDGSGTVRFTIDAARGEVCYRITVKDIGRATQAHIHRGAKGVAGDVVLNLMPPGADGTVNSCSAADNLLVEELQSNPAGFYVNVHNEEFPNGALRAQLG